ncbi:hypothetical protein NBRC110019_27330 [Neptunitalea chrysea]|uniref:Lipoprotein n=1 Tax=Neptunitalea chrysea TaxID=1647581 RepID=A0A9W6EWC5_9FLAO|nr:hypothetical protein [Neptunitalea chrysea]GLB53692.1 hypothetical protein NBRC110019_27330 [Neptunitalea chrysea]
MNTKLYVIIIILAIGLSGISCSKHQKNIASIPVTNVLDSSTVIIKVITDNPNIKDKIVILNEKKFYTANQKNLVEKLENNNQTISYSKDQKAEFKEIRIGKKRFFVYITPGDKLTLNIKHDSINLYGTHTAEYNFFIELKRKNLIPPNFNKNSKVYKTILDSIYEKQITFLNNYHLKHPEISKTFLDDTNNELLFQYYYYLCFPRGIKNFLKNQYLSHLDGIYSKYRNNSAFEADEYFNSIDVSLFKNKNLINSRHFKQALSFLIRFYFIKNNTTYYSKESFLNEKKYIDANFSDDLHSYLIGRFLISYSYKKFHNSLDNYQLLKQTLDNFNQNSTDKTIPKLVYEVLSKNDFKKNNFKLPKDVTTEKIISSKGDTLSFGDILNSKRIIKIVFTNDNSKNINLDNSYSKTESLITVYLNKPNENTFKNKSDFFYLVTPYNSKIIKYLQIFSLPYIITLDKNNRLLSKEPLPSVKK